MAEDGSRIVRNAATIAVPNATASDIGVRKVPVGQAHRFVRHTAPPDLCEALKGRGWGLNGLQSPTPAVSAVRPLYSAAVRA
jgi:hypothetical protein